MTETRKQKMIYLRVRDTGREYLVTACDEKLLGATISEGELELYVSEHFFGGELVPIEKCLQEMMKATSFNLIGEDIVNAAIKARLVNEFSVLWINSPNHGRVGHVLFVR